MGLFASFLENQISETTPANAANLANLPPQHTQNSQLSRVSQAAPAKTEIAGGQKAATVARGKSKKTVLEGPAAGPPDEAEIAIEERAGTSASVPERYVNAWARFQLQCPGGVTEERWRQAIGDASRFLDQWGKLADSFGWLPGDLFDGPGDGVTGLCWWLKGRTVSALGPEHAGVGQPAYDRVTRREWVNPYTRQVRPVSLSPILEHQQKIMQRVLGR
jgi:hypothetical protein